MDLGKSLKFFRAKAGLKQEYICEKIRVGKTHFSQVEKNRREPSLSLLKRLADMYNIPLPIIFLYALEEKEIPDKSKYHFKLLMSLVEILTDDCFDIKKENFNNIDPDDDLAVYPHSDLYESKLDEEILQVKPFNQ